MTLRFLLCTRTTQVMAEVKPLLVGKADISAVGGRIKDKLGGK
jgi:hypothetical protein